MSKITLQNAMIVFGALLLLSGLGGGMSVDVKGGMNLLLGALAISARKHQSPSRSVKWLVIEVVSILLILLTTIPGLIIGLWYSYPISFLVPTIVIVVGYVDSWRKFK